MALSFNTPNDFTEDSILGGQIKLLQPKSGYRVAIDPIVLAYFVSVRQHQEILDVGCGVGTISLILKAKEKLARIAAIDTDKEMCLICQKNAQINSLDIDITNIGIEHINEHALFQSKLFDHVVTNPPFFEQKSSRISEAKKMANFETINLIDWIAFCVKKLKNNGIFSIIHKASRIDDILYALKNIAGSIVIIPIFPKNNCEANRVIVQAKKSSRSETKILSGIVAHNDDGSYSEHMRNILYQQMEKK
ncbi:MAG: methyltransferase [Holosporaceae bacterium]|jgi:tRNA1(Val) A37 N6-methylase TrmN6|nr:methyltransferase [Holosporaceae bacterium]